MAAGQFVDAWKDGPEEDSDRVFRYQPQYLSEGSSSLAADVALAGAHHAEQAGELGLMYQDSLFEAAGSLVASGIVFEGPQLRPEIFSERPPG